MTPHRNFIKCKITLLGIVPNEAIENLFNSCCELV
jgi:hypothetical protein